MDDEAWREDFEERQAFLRGGGFEQRIADERLEVAVDEDADERRLPGRPFNSQIHSGLR